MRIARDFVVSAFEGHRKGNIACIYPVSFEDAEALRCRSLLADRRLVHATEIHIDITARMDRSMACGIDHMCTETDRVPGHVVGFVRMQVDLLLRIERELTTVYKNPELNVTFTQEGYELAAMDRAYVTFTVTQPGYTGRYKAHLSGEGLTFFQGHYSADIPTTELTLYEGNGTYELRLKPEP